MGHFTEEQKRMYRKIKLEAEKKSRQCTDDLFKNSFFSDVDYFYTYKEFVRSLYFKNIEHFCPIDKEGDIFLERGTFSTSEIKYALTAIVTLFAIIIRKDSVVRDEEISVAHEYFDRRFKTSNIISIFKKDAKEMKSYLNVCLRYSSMRNANLCALDILSAKFAYVLRLELLDYLFKTAYVDQGVCEEELDRLLDIAKYLRISEWDLNSLQYKYECRRETESATIENYRDQLIASSYKMLGLENSATELEIKESYRNLVKQYHPDKLSQDLSIEEYEEAVMKFRQVTEAYQIICKEKGIK